MIGDGYFPHVSPRCFFSSSRHSASTPYRLRSSLLRLRRSPWMSTVARMSIRRRRRASAPAGNANPPNAIPTLSPCAAPLSTADVCVVEPAPRRRRLTISVFPGASKRVDHPFSDVGRGSGRLQRISSRVWPGRGIRRQAPYPRRRDVARGRFRECTKAAAPSSLDTLAKRFSACRGASWELMLLASGMQVDPTLVGSNMSER
jgi:hypothetical protein